MNNLPPHQDGPTTCPAAMESSTLAYGAAVHPEKPPHGPCGDVWVEYPRLRCSDPPSVGSLRWRLEMGMSIKKNGMGPAAAGLSSHGIRFLVLVLVSVLVPVLVLASVPHTERM
mmetsp:Transcript_27357/g.43584  ORF Transcript_27357/g.43584 Transcript_27357/m.43584 type:complete len:114 (+) Transcript_27357:796-1137(+)